MKLAASLFSLLLLFCAEETFAQGCTTLGQNPSTAFPVCGSNTFIQNTVPLCSNPRFPVPGCTDGADYGKNPYWYKFTCFQSGTLSFLITPHIITDDYDWQLFDITGKSPNDIYSDPSLVVTGNWSGTTGVTGANASGVNYIQCASNPSDGRPKFALSPNIIQGRNYLLIVSHYDDTQSGYDLSFGGGTAVITDPKLPLLKSADAACDGTKIRVKLNKDMKCNTLAANGSDFTLSPSLPLTNAVSTQCSTSFDMTELELTVGSPLPPGTYTLRTQLGTDGNTLKDNCDRQIPVGDTLQFTVYPLVPTPMDSLTKVKCAPQKLELVFRKKMQCNSVAANGTDFIVTGPSAVVVSAAAGDSCVNGLSNKIIVTLSGPLQLGGIYNIRLVNGSDGNTITDDCAQQTPAGSNINFLVSDTVNADFTFGVLYGCAQNTINYLHDGRNGVNLWQWKFDTTSTSPLQNPIITYNNFKPKSTQLIVSNGVCKDTSAQVVIFDNYIEARFTSTNILCPGESASFKELSLGNLVEWKWDFGNGLTSNLKDPPIQFYAPRGNADYNARPQLIVKNDFGCADTTLGFIRIAYSCFIAVPSAFTPNGDGRNDYLYPLQAYKATNLNFSVFNRFGELVFNSKDWTYKWDGRHKGQAADAGTYVWTLSYTNSDNGAVVNQKGTTVLVR